MNLAALQDALNKEFQTPMGDMVVRSNPMLAGLTKRSLSTDRIWLRHKTASAHQPEVITDGAAVTVGTPASTYGAGVLDWNTYIAKFSLPKRLLGQVQDNPEMLGQLFYTEIQDAAADLSDKIAQDIYQSTGSAGLAGLPAIFDTANTYAGIDRTSAAYWQALVVDAAAGALGTGTFYDAELAWFGRNKNELFSPRVSPVGFTSKTLQVIYKELFENISYDALGTAHYVNQANAGNSFGKSGVGFNGMPILADPNCVPVGDTAATDRMYIVNPASLFLAHLTPNDDSEVVRMQQLDPSKGEATDGIQIQIEILGNTGESIQGYVKTYCQLVCQDPTKAGVLIKNISNVRA